MSLKNRCLLVLVIFIQVGWSGFQFNRALAGRGASNCAVQLSQKPWEAVQSFEFIQWYKAQDSKVQQVILKAVERLESIGPTLARPYADSVYQSVYSNMKEIRIKTQGKIIRIFFAFGPDRHPVLLLGGDKRGDDRFYEQMISRADTLFDLYLRKFRSPR